MDFNIRTYIALLSTLKKNGYAFQPVKEFIESPTTKVIILRHDVDRLPQNALALAKIENNFGICGTYYFRIVKGSFDPAVIKEIAGLGHEIGYHYEDMDLAIKLRKKYSGNGSEELEQITNRAIHLFSDHLKQFRELVPVYTICMHGSPLSRYDNRSLWKKYDYRSYEIIGEPYFDIDFSKVLYLTDTGRRWNGERISVRDKEYFPENITYKATASSRFSLRRTRDIIRSIEEEGITDQVMITIHPQRWSENLLPWIKELLWQNVKNIVKYILIRNRNQ